MIHTACPFIKQQDLKDENVQKQITSYQAATMDLIDALAAKDRTKKIIMTGSASSIIGQNPSVDEGHVYDNPLVWADIEE